MALNDIPVSVTKSPSSIYKYSESKAGAVGKRGRNLAEPVKVPEGKVDSELLRERESFHAPCRERKMAFATKAPRVEDAWKVESTMERASAACSF